jgi:hypothetical protein
MKDESRNEPVTHECLFTCCDCLVEFHSDGGTDYVYNMKGEPVCEDCKKLTPKVRVGFIDSSRHYACAELDGEEVTVYKGCAVDRVIAMCQILYNRTPYEEG